MLAPRDQVTRAGFFFALQVLARSIPHRIALATSAGIAIALTTVILRRTDLQQARLDATFELLTIQPLFLAAVLAGFLARDARARGGTSSRAAPAVMARSR